MNDSGDVTTQCIPSVRPRTLTEKGHAHELENLHKQSKKLINRIDKRTEILNSGAGGVDYKIIKELDEAQKEFLEVVSKLRNLADDSVSADEINRLNLAVISAKMYALKLNESDIDSRKLAGNPASLPGIRTEVGNDVAFSETRSMTAVSSKTVRESSGRIAKFLNQRLCDQLSLVDHVLQTDDADHVKNESANLDRRLSDLIDANSRLMELMNDSEKVTQTAWIQEIDANVFQMKQKICTWLVDHNDTKSKSTKSGSSRSKSSSNGSKSRTHSTR